MKIALVNQNNEHFGGELDLPLGLAYLAAYIRSKNSEIILDIKDMSIMDEKEISDFYSTNYDIVGFSVMSAGYNQTMDIVRRLKADHPDTITVFGGPHVSVVMDEILKEPFIDLAVYGEGEITFHEIIERIDPDILSNTNVLSKINGLIYRDGNRIVVNPPRNLIDNLDELPMPAFDLFNMDRYPGPFPIITSRGCPFNCVFCASSAIWGRTWRKRSPESIVREIEYLLTKYGKRPILFQDDAVNIDKKRMHEICDLILKRKFGVPVVLRGVRVDLVDKNIAKKMRKMGTTNIGIGIESANDSMLKKMGKKTTTSKILKGIKNLHSAGIAVDGQFMIGNPGETLETVQNSLAFIKKSKIFNATWGTAIPFPNTGLWHYVKKSGELLTDKPCTEYDFLFPRILFETKEFTKEQRHQAIKMVESHGFIVHGNTPPVKAKKRETPNYHAIIAKHRFNNRFPTWVFAIIRRVKLSIEKRNRTKAFIKNQEQFERI